MSKKFSLVFALVLVAGLLLAACGGATPADPAATAAPAADAATAAAEQSSTGGAGASSGGVLTLGEQSMPTFTRNFNPLIASALPGTLNLIHEPLMIYNTITGACALAGE